MRNKLITLSTYHLNSKLPIIFSQLHCSHNFYNNNNENRTALEQQLLHFALLGVAAPLLYHFLHIVHIHQTEHFVYTLFSTIIMSIFTIYLFLYVPTPFCKTKRRKHGEELRECGEIITRWLTRIAFVCKLSGSADSSIADRWQLLQPQVQCFFLTCVFHCSAYYLILFQ